MWPMRLAGIDIDYMVVRELAVLLRRGGFVGTAETLESAVGANQPDVALTILEREAIIWVLDNTRTRALARLRAVLVQEHLGRVHDGLV